ncbi:hypothetical protein, partial [Microvirga aerophila]|uniref:hypothetical protein n=1 Tax=Microvirga aerophila TaxID=670291 RepID=UPI001AEE8835
VPCPVLLQITPIEHQVVSYGRMGIGRQYWPAVVLGLMEFERIHQDEPTNLLQSPIVILSMP